MAEEKGTLRMLLPSHRESPESVPNQMMPFLSSRMDQTVLLFSPS